MKKQINFSDSLNDLLIQAENRKVIQLVHKSNQTKENSLLVREHQMINFGTCGYLGLEKHPQLINACKNFAEKHGTQFSISRTYVTDENSIRLEKKLSQIFQGNPVLTSSSTTLMHTCIIPFLMTQNDLLILDQQCHASIQSAVQQVQSKGVKVEIIKHSNLQMLHDKLLKNENSFERIWYLCDGVYSMFGDLAPIDELNQLMHRFPNFFLYIDDAHGMSWSGPNGCGRIYPEIVGNKRTMYVTTMAKGFGVMGGIAVFPNQDWYAKIKRYGGALTHSHPIPPPILGACLASADLHLSDEMSEIQNRLQDNIRYAHECLKRTKLPIVSNPETPIFYVACGKPEFAYELINGVMNDGFYVSIGMFPAVPLKKAGLRFTINAAHTKQEISSFVKSVELRFDECLDKLNVSLEQIMKSFGITNQKSTDDSNHQSRLRINYRRSINEIDAEVWNDCLGEHGNFDHETLQMMEKAFDGNNKTEDNWDFHYILIHDALNNLILATFLTSALIKDDLFHNEKISQEVEELRKDQPYAFCSKTLMMGSLCTEGDHLFINLESPLYEEAFRELLHKIEEIQRSEQIAQVLLRDFEETNPNLKKILHNQAYLELSLPPTNIVKIEQDDEKMFYASLGKRNKRHIREDVYRYSSKVELEIADNLSTEELEKTYDMFLAVNKKNKGINVFPYPKKFFNEINNSSKWEFIKVYAEGKLAAISICYLGISVYQPLLVGIDYELNNKVNAYRQLLYQVCLRAIHLHKKSILLGFTADVEKRKVGAKQVNKFAYLHLEDTFVYDALERIQYQNK